MRPLLLDYLGGREDRLSDYTPERLAGASKTRRKVKSAPGSEA